jgi:DNA ligase-1
MMPDLEDGESVQMAGSGATPYTLKNVGGVYSCTCPAWRNQSLAIDKRTCKHLKKLRGEAEEAERVAGAVPRPRLAGAPRPTATPGEVLPAAEPTTKAPVLLAQPWSPEVDVTGWWMSEKLDGIRAYWDGRQLVSRLGNVFFAPDWFIADLPDHPLDGELFLGRKAFQRTSGIVRRQDRGDGWKELKYLVFDAPSHPGTFEERLEALSDLRTPWAEVHPHERIEDMGSLTAELDRITALGGEGLMARKPGSKYEIGRSWTLLKLKRFLDGEARVVGHQAGQGKHAGRLGALLVELADGTGFAIGTGFSDAEREAPPPLGTIVSFRYQELSDGGVPRFPTWAGIRVDAPASARLDARIPAPEPAAPRVRPERRPAPVVESLPGAVRLELSGGHPKFWEGAVDGSRLVLRVGRVGTAGMSRSQDHASPEEAAAALTAMIAEKRLGGYA